MTPRSRKDTVVGKRISGAIQPSRAASQPKEADLPPPPIAAQLQAARHGHSLSTMTLGSGGVLGPVGGDQDTGLRPPPDLEQREEDVTQARQSLQGHLAQRGLTVQPQVRVGAPNDVYEQEANRVAAQVMRMPSQSGQTAAPDLSSGQQIGITLHTKPLAASINRTVQRSVSAGQTEPGLVGPQALGLVASSTVEQGLSASSSGGSALPQAVRAFMEPRFGADFSGVRVHTDSQSAEMNHQLNAMAFTHGNHIYYGSGTAPASDELTAHELTHVVQQTGAIERKPLGQAGGSSQSAFASPVLGHLQALRGGMGGEATVYRKEIAAFQQATPTATILDQQRQLLPSQDGRLIQQRDHSGAIRCCGNSGGLTITPETEFDTPENTGKNRKRVGVGEKVTFTGSASGDWTATEGQPNAQAASPTFVWVAPNRAASVTIMLKVGEREKTETMEVIEPDSIRGVKNDELAYPAGQQGAGMHLNFNLQPRNVSFANIETKEVSGPASGISGYFANYPAANLWHNSGDTFFPIGRDNALSGAQDTAAFNGWPQPWSKGGFEWRIPNHFRVRGEGGDGKQYTTVTQAFSISADGTSKVEKAGVSVERTP